MSYIIVWRNSHREPFVDVNSNSFKEDHSSYEEAKTAADEIQANENVAEKPPWYFDYQIYQKVDN